MAIAKKLKSRPLKPLKHFDYKLVQERLDGLLINVDRDLQRRVDKMPSPALARCPTLLDVIVRFTTNAYHSVCYLMADTPEDAARRESYALTIAPVNRQLLDLLFSLVYMLDDFEKRSLEYQRAGWREIVEEYQKFSTEFAHDPEWKPFLDAQKQTIDFYEKLFGITAAQRAKPSLIPFWKHPSELKNARTASRPFLRWLDKWLYHDTSAQAHLSFGGLLAVSPILVAELVSEDAKKHVSGRTFPQYRFRQFSRTALVTLAIATEANHSYCLGNSAQVSYVWKVFVEHIPEAREMFKMRYDKMT